MADGSEEFGSGEDKTSFTAPAGSPDSQGGLIPGLRGLRAKFRKSGEIRVASAQQEAVEEISRFEITWVTRGINNIAEIRPNKNHPGFKKNDYEGVDPDKPSIVDEVVIPGLKSLDEQGYKITSLVPIIVNSGGEGSRSQGMMVLVEPSLGSKE